MRRLFILLAILCGLALVGGAGYLGFRSSQPTAVSMLPAPLTVPVGRGDVQQTVTAPGQLTGMHEIVLGMGVGTVKQVYVRAGETVKQGDVLAELDATDLQLALAAAQAAYNQQQANFNHAREGASEADVMAAQAAVESAQAAYAAAVQRAGLNDDQLIAARAQFNKAGIALHKAQSDYDQAVVDHRTDLSTLSTSLQTAKVDYEAAQANYNLQAAGINDTGVRSTAASLAAAKASLLKLQTGQTESERQAAEAQLEQAHISVQQAQSRLRSAQVVAPFDGMVLEVKATAGDMSSGSWVIRMTDPRAVEVRATVVEEDFPLVAAGQPVELFFDALPGISVSGHVARIIPMRDAGANPIYPIMIALDDPPTGLAPGMTADAAVQIARSGNVLRLPRALVRARTDGTALVKVWSNGQSVDRIVQVGLRGSQYVEIVAGVHEGDLVVSR